MAASKQGVTLKLQGLPHTRQTFVELEDRIKKRVLKKSVRAGAGPVVKTLRGHVKRSASDTGWFVRNVTQKVKIYRSGRALAIIGAQKKKDPVTGRNPANYDHLVEDGAKAHTIPGPLSIVLPSGEKLATGEINHPGATPRRVFEQADREARAKGEEAFRNKFAAETMREAAGLAKP